MKSQDIVILYKLVSLQEQEENPAEQPLFEGWQGWDYAEDGGEEAEHFDRPIPTEAYSARGLEAALGISKTEINASIKRSVAIGMAVMERESGKPRVNRRALLEFSAHGIQYVFPARPAEIQRGIPTAFSAPVLKNELRGATELVPVWPDAYGKEMGQRVEPLYKSVSFAVKKDPKLYEYLALVDAVRLGQSREKQWAIDRLTKKLDSK
jgi:hypothetical protein